MSGKIAITGGAGFLGSHIVDYFVENGEDVVVIDDFSDGTRENLSNSIEKANCEVREVNLCEREATLDSFSDIQYIVHLAAKIGGIGYFHRVPADIISLNNAMCRNVFDAAVEYEIVRVVYASSSMVYERSTEFPVTENQVGEIPPPESAYGFQKLAGEYYCHAYRDQYDLEYSIFRPFNAVGPREPPGEEVGQAHVIPDFVKKILEEDQNPLEIIGDGKQIRAFTNVRDIAKGVYKCTFESVARNEDYNLGSSEEVDMQDLAQKIWNLSGREAELTFLKKEGFEYDVKRRIPDSSKAHEHLGWKPEIALDDSLEEYLDWYEREVI